MKEKALHWFILVFPCVFGWGFGYMAYHEAGIQDSRTRNTLSLAIPSASPVAEVSPQSTLLECLCPGRLNRLLELPWLLKITLGNPGFLQRMDLFDYTRMALPSSAGRPKETIAGNEGSSHSRMLLLHPALRYASSWQLKGHR